MARSGTPDETTAILSPVESSNQVTEMIRWLPYSRALRPATVTLLDHVPGPFAPVASNHPDRPTTPFAWLRKMSKYASPFAYVTFRVEPGGVYVGWMSSLTRVKRLGRDTLTVWAERMARLSAIDFSNGAGWIQ